MVPDLFTDYLASIPEEDKAEWKECMEKWDLEFDLSSRVEFQMEVRPLTDDDIDVLVRRMEEIGDSQTVGKKTYIELEKLATGTTAYLFAEFDAHGNQFKDKINLTATHRVARLNGKDLLLLTWGGSARNKTKAASKTGAECKTEAASKTEAAAASKTEAANSSH